MAGIINRLEWWTTRGGLGLIGLGVLEHSELLKVVGLGFIVVSVVFDIATKGGRYARFVVNTRDRLWHRYR